MLQTRSLEAGEVFCGFHGIQPLVRSTDGKLVAVGGPPTDRFDPAPGCWGEDPRVAVRTLERGMCAECYRERNAGLIVECARHGLQPPAEGACCAVGAALQSALAPSDPRTLPDAEAGIAQNVQGTVQHDGMDPEHGLPTASVGGPAPECGDPDGGRDEDPPGSAGGDDREATGDPPASSGPTRAPWGLTHEDFAEVAAMLGRGPISAGPARPAESPEAEE
jgi:hypothetical protein